MSTIPADVKQPQDRKAPAAAITAVQDEDSLLADLPPLIPPTKLRLRQRNKIMRLALRLNSFAGDEGIELDADTDPATFEALLDVLADIDEFAETIADDPAAYVKWAQGASYEQFSALLTRYSSAVGESSSSSS